MGGILKNRIVSIVVVDYAWGLDGSFGQFGGL